PRPDGPPPAAGPLAASARRSVTRTPCPDGPTGRGQPRRAAGPVATPPLRPGRGARRPAASGPGWAACRRAAKEQFAFCEISLILLSAGKWDGQEPGRRVNGVWRKEGPGQ